MPMTEVSYGGATPIDGYGPGFFRVGGEVFQGAVLVTASGASAWGGWEDTSLLAGIAEETDVLILGTGEEMTLIPAPFRATVEALEIGVEPMASATAARTYNVLLSEGRRVAALLLPVG
ncbi:Mth938-like domain-containing protein [Ostreiculturibacter nitratireducens]|uniref:Mth938-like domain-containing protein n=1 Tax=Ostreiculturibacter nitratireducens TaxID=3075226 RepID=UPI0031B5E996